MTVPEDLSPVRAGLAQAMVLAAGRGSRMRPLTDQTPKPLLAVQGRPLLHRTLSQLAAGGVQRTVLNTAWLGAQIERYFGVHPSLGEGLSMHLRYSVEQQPGAEFAALETAGGISRALPCLDDVFWVAAGDVFAPEFHYSSQALQAFAASDHLAHLWLVPNPVHHPQGDFGLTPQGLACSQPEPGTPAYTYSTIGLYRRALFEAPWCDIEPGNPQGLAVKLAPLLRLAMDAGRVSAQIYHGPWTDVGTPERLAELNAV